MIKFQVEIAVLDDSEIRMYYPNGNYHIITDTDGGNVTLRKFVTKVLDNEVRKLQEILEKMK